MRQPPACGALGNRASSIHNEALCITKPANQQQFNTHADALKSAKLVSEPWGIHKHTPSTSSPFQHSRRRAQVCKVGLRALRQQLHGGAHQRRVTALQAAHNAALDRAGTHSLVGGWGGRERSGEMGVRHTGGGLRRLASVPVSCAVRRWHMSTSSQVGSFNA